MKVENRRRSDRVVIGVPVRVSAVDAAGEKFSEQGHTLNISRHGATIALSRKLTPGLRLTISPLATRRESSALVMGQIGGQAGVHVYGIALLEPNVNLWGIQFPPLVESAEALVRLLLECNVCNAREVVHLNELETDVFEGNHSLPRPCSQCGTWTLWSQSPNNLPAGQPEDQSNALPKSKIAPLGQAQNKRKHVRVHVNMKACIRHPGFEEEIVDVKDVSRGGLSFLSSKGYIEGSRIEVAVPYADGKANIFVAARISRAQEIPGKGVTRYGAQYIRTR